MNDFTEDEQTMICTCVKDWLGEKMCWVGSSGFAFVSYEVENLKSNVSIALNILSKMHDSTVDGYRKLKFIDLNESDMP